MPTTAFDLSPNSRTWGRCTLTNVSGQRGLGFFRLAFHLNIDVHPVSEGIHFKLVSFAGDLTTQNRLLGGFASPQQRFPVEPYAYVSQQSVDFSLDLDRARLEALEEARRGGDVQLSMQYFATFVPDDGRPYPQAGQVALTIGQSDWVRILAELDYAQTLLIEVPIPDPRAEPELAGATAFLSRAQQAVARGEYREAVGLCRDVMEEMEKALPCSTEPDFKNPKALDKSERLALMRRATKLFTHPARHRDEAATRFEWSRRDAVFAVTTVAALLNELGAPDAMPAKGVPHAPADAAVSVTPPNGEAAPAGAHA